MNKFILLLATIVCFYSCSDNNASIKGKISNAGKTKVYLNRLNVSDVIVVDSAKLSSSGEFDFGVKVDNPSFYSLRFGNGETLTLVVSPDEALTISGNLSGLNSNYWVDGSENSLWIKVLDYRIHETRTKMDSIQTLFSTMQTDDGGVTNEMRLLAAEYDSVLVSQVNFTKEFILKHAVSPASYYALYQKFDKENYIITPEENFQSFKIVATSMLALYPEAPYTKALKTHVDKINEDLRNYNLKQIIANSEPTLPSVALPNVNGDTISLISKRGKFILLDFTILNAKESVDATNDLKAAYNKFKSKGFEIYQVCLDPNDIQWKNAVKQLGINWLCVRDGNALNSRAAMVWNVKTIPANYLIDRNYNIVGKNLYGRELMDRLNDVVK